jgi:hypothetical protein
LGGALGVVSLPLVASYFGNVGRWWRRRNIDHALVDVESIVGSTEFRRIASTGGSKIGSDAFREVLGVHLQ